MRSAGMRHSAAYDFIPARGPQLRPAHEGQHRETDDAIVVDVGRSDTHRVSCHSRTAAIMASFSRGERSTLACVGCPAGNLLYGQA
jgi:hypothetical protein